MFRSAFLTAFSTATGTSVAFPYPQPTRPFLSPTTTRAEKLKRRPPLTTHEQRRICTTCSGPSARLSRPPRPPRPRPPPGPPPRPRPPPGPPPRPPPGPPPPGPPPVPPVDTILCSRPVSACPGRPFQACACSPRRLDRFADDVIRLRNSIPLHAPRRPVKQSAHGIRTSPDRRPRP